MWVVECFGGLVADEKAHVASFDELLDSHSEGVLDGHYEELLVEDWLVYFDDRPVVVCRRVPLLYSK